jgi:tRNA A-37 threonylcarbamoyl transferase component Bud32
MRKEINPTYSNNKSLQNFIARLPQRFEAEGEVIFSGKRNIIKTFCIDAEDEVLSNVVVKKFRARNIFQQLAYSTFWASKAKRAYHNGLRLVKMDEGSTPFPIAFVEDYGCGILHQCYYITDFTDAPSVREQLETQPFNRPLAKAFAHFIARLHKNGLVHHDLNFSNVLYKEETKGDEVHYHISVIDINRLTSHDNLTIDDCKDDFVRWTDDMQLFTFVMEEYAKTRQLDIEIFKHQALMMKRQHNKDWARRKGFLALLRC